MIYTNFKFNMHLVNQEILKADGTKIAEGAIFDEEYGTEGNVLTDIRDDIDAIKTEKISTLMLKFLAWKIRCIFSMIL